jgi:hypothetical protein
MMKNQKKKANKNEQWHWSLTFLIVSWFVGVPIIFIHGIGDTIVGFPAIALIILGSGLVSLLSQTPLFSYLRKKQGGEKYIVGKQLFVLYNMLGVGVAACALVLQLNYIFQSDTPIVEEYEIVKVDPDYRVGSYTGVVYIIAGGKYENNVDARWFEIRAASRKRDRPFVRYVSYKGLFGFIVLTDRYLVSGPDDPTPYSAPLL